MSKPKYPAYLCLSEKQWDEKLQKSKELASPCVLCGRRCRVMRFGNTESTTGRPSKKAETAEDSITADFAESKAGSVRPAIGVCRTGDKAVVSSFGPHFGEEPPLVGTRGSGTIFFSNCNLRCVFCQNYDIAHFDRGHEVTDDQLGRLMLRVQEMGCHNVNLVSPTHVVPSILSAVRWAAGQGLNIPLVYNTGGYDSIETISLLDGVIDIYMPDMKYGEAESAREFSMAPDYPEVNFAAVKEMHRQVGDLVIDENGLALRGLLVRHLVLPEKAAGTEKVMKFIAEEISRGTYVNIMDQYRPYYKAAGHPVLGRRVTFREYRAALKTASKAGLTRVQAL